MNSRESPSKAVWTRSRAPHRVAGACRTAQRNATPQVEPPLAKTHNHWEHFSHDADLGLRGWGTDRPRLFVAMAEALTAAITDPADVAQKDCVEIGCSAPSDDILMADWLNALVYEMAVRRMLFSRFDVAIDDGELRALAYGEAVNREKHRPAVEVKGVTLTTLEVARTTDGWRAQCVVDV